MIDLLALGCATSFLRNSYQIEYYWWFFFKTFLGCSNAHICKGNRVNVAIL